MSRNYDTKFRCAYGENTRKAPLYSHPQATFHRLIWFIPKGEAHCYKLLSMRCIEAKQKIIVFLVRNISPSEYNYHSCYQLLKTP
jgi:hypothetical protein